MKELRKREYDFANCTAYLRAQGIPIRGDPPPSQNGVEMEGEKEGEESGSDHGSRRLFFLNRLEVLPDGFELLAGITLENFRAESSAIFRIGVAGHLGVGDEACRIEHPLVEVILAEAVVSESEIDTLNFKSGDRLLVVDPVASDAGVSFDPDNLFADFDESGIGFCFGRLRFRKAVVMGEPGGEFGGVVIEGRHAHFEPRARAWIGGAHEHFAEVARVEHRSHVGEGRP